MSFDPAIVDLGVGTMEDNKFRWPQPPYGLTLFADDIRHEVGGKITIVGSYTGEIGVPAAFPITLPGIVIRAHLVVDKSLAGREVSFFVFFPGDNTKPTIDQKMKVIPLIERPPDYGILLIAEFVGRPVVIQQEGLIRVMAEVEGDRIGIGSLLIRSIQPPPVGEASDVN